MRKLAILCLLPLGLSACETMGQPENYIADRDRLDADCEARNGVLIPTGRSTGRAETDHVCRIIGATRLPSN